jgi:WD40 repeat protein/serine/threonine protein kinase
MASQDSHNQALLLDRLAEEFAERYRKGERPALQEYLDRYPELADELRELLPAMAQIEQVKEDAGDPGGACGPAAPPLRQLGDYHILREVGHGGMGVVYEAEQVSLGRRVALKVLPPQLLREARQRRRFEREARAAARLHHTNIVPVFGVGEHEGAPYYVMQFIQGLGLDAVLDELKRLQPGGAAAAPPTGGGLRVARKDCSAADVARSLLTGDFRPAAEATCAHTPAPAEGAAGPPPVAPLPAPREVPAGRLSDSFELSSSSVRLPGQSGTGPKQKGKPTYWRSVAQVGVQVAGALDYAHRQGVLHRDVKPSNLLLDTAGTVWVTDFGLAKVGDQENLTHTGDVLGTLRYMPPEAFEGKADPRSDVYSLGLTLYELLALRPAFEERDRNRLIKQVTTAEPPPLRRASPAVPRDLATVVHKAVEKEPGHRYASAAELAADLQRFIDDEPIRARRLSPAERCWRWCRHNPAVATLAGAVLLLLLAVAAVATTGYVQTSLALGREAEQRQAADEAAGKAAAAEARALVAAAAAKDEAARNRRLLYDADMQLAAQFWEGENGTARAVTDLLEAHVPGAGEEDLRDFAWHYQRGLLRRAVTLEGHKGAPLVAFAAGGRLLTFDWARVLRYWTKAGPPATGAEDFVRVGTVSSWALAPGGAVLALGTAEGRVVLYDVASGRRRTLLQGAAALQDVEFSGDGRKLVSIHRDGTARLWDLTAGKELAALRLRRAAFHDAALSPDGGMLALANHPENALLSVYRFGDPRPRTLPLGITVHCVAFSPDGKVLASGNGQVILWDAATLEERGRFAPQGGFVTRLAFSPDGGRLAAGGSDGLVTVWDVKARRRLRRLKGHTAAVASLDFAADGKALASGSRDGTARLWDLELPDEGRKLALAKGEEAVGSGLACSADGKWLAVAGFPATLWDARTERRAHVLDNGNCLAFSPDGKTLAVGGTYVSLWDVASGRQLRFLNSPLADPAAERRAVGSLAFSPDGKLMAVGFGMPTLFGPAEYQQVVKIWDVRSGKELHTLPHRNTVPALAFSPDGKTLAAACHDGTVRLWEVGTWREVRQLRPRPGGASGCTAAAFSPKGEILAAASWDGTVRLWEPATGTLRRELKGHANAAFGVAFSPDGKTLTSASFDHTIKLWDVRSGRELRTLAGHTDWVYCAAFSPDGKTLVSCGGDRSVRLWEALPPWERAGKAEGEVRAALGARPRDPRLWIDYGRHLASRGDRAGAEAAFARALELPADRPEPWLGLARYLAAHGDRAGAEAAFARAVASKPAYASTWRERGRFYLHEGRPDRAAADFLKAVALEPDDPWTWFQTAPLLLRAGDVAGYRRHCRAMLQRFGKTRDPVLAERMAKVCLLLPGPPEELALPAALADQALRAGERHPFRPYFELSRALADYRRGQFPAAEVRLRKLLGGGRSWDVAVPACLVLAMARQQLGRPGPAREALAEGLRQLERTVPQVADAGGSWHDWLICQIFRHEAQALLGATRVEPGK